MHFFASGYFQYFGCVFHLVNHTFFIALLRRRMCDTGCLEGKRNLGGGFRHACTADVIEKGVVPAQLASIIRAVLQVVAHCHAVKFLHRDIKPGVLSPAAYGLPCVQAHWLCPPMFSAWLRASCHDHCNVLIILDRLIN